MVELEFYRDEKRNYQGVLCKGHAGGKDSLVCAALSALMQTLFLGIRDVLEIPCLYKKESGYMGFFISSREGIKIDEEKVRCLFETARLGFEKIAESSDERTIKIYDKEITSHGA